MMTEHCKAEELTAKGWIIFSPTVVCDRIGIRDGRIYLMEFKKHGQGLTSGQRMAKSLAPARYKVFHLT